MMMINEDGNNDDDDDNDRCYVPSRRMVITIVVPVASRFCMVACVRVRVCVHLVGCRVRSAGAPTTSVLYTREPKPD